MTQFAQWIDPAKANTKIVQASEAPILEKLVNDYIASLDGTKVAITAITLAGAGDGFTFVALIETAPVGASNSDSSLVIGASGGLTPSIPPPIGSQLTFVRCYLASTAESLSIAKGFVAPPVITFLTQKIPTVVVDEQVAGSAKGTRFMGMNVYTGSTVPAGLFESSALFPILPAQFPSAGPALPFLLSFGSPIGGANWSLQGPNAIQYDGTGSFMGRFDATLTVELGVGVVPAAFTAEFLESPLSVAPPPSFFGTINASIDVLLGSENIALVYLRSVVRTPAPLKEQFGMRLNLPAGTFNVLSGYLRITP